MHRDVKIREARIRTQDVDLKSSSVLPTIIIIYYLLLNRTRSTEYSTKINNLRSQLARANMRDNDIHHSASLVYTSVESVSQKPNRNPHLENGDIKPY